jgi:hypothetical protein
MAWCVLVGISQRLRTWRVFGCVRAQVQRSRGKIILAVCEAVHIPPAGQALNHRRRGWIGHGGQFHAHDGLGCGHMRDRTYGLVNVDAAQAQRYDAENATDGLTGKAAHGNLEMTLRCLTRKQQ